MYHQILTDLEIRGEQYVSSHYLAAFMLVDDTQVRKDVALIGYRGKPKSGYSVTGLKKAIEDFLGINYENTAILVGAGRLGSALSEYPGFAEYGLRIIALFDIDLDRVGTEIGGLKVKHISEMPDFVKSNKVGIAILTVPKKAAQILCEKIISLEIKAIWNFVPIRLTVPDNVIVRNENLAVGIALLSHYIKQQKWES